MSVKRARVGDVLSLQRRPVAVSFESVYEEIGIRSFGRGVFHKEPVSGTALGSKRVFWIEPGDLLLSNVFAWEGAIAVAGSAERGKIGSHRFMTYTAVDDRIDTNWASWYFRSDPGLELIRRASPGSAGRNRTLAIDRFEALQIPLPPIDEQKRISAYLGGVQQASVSIANLAARATALTEATVDSLVSRPDLSESQKSRAGWRTMQLGELLALDISEVAVEPTASYDIAGVYSFGRGLFPRASIEGNQTSYKTLHRLREGQIVMSRLKAWEGALAVVTSAMDGSFVSPEFPTFRVHNDAVERDFVGLVLSAEPFWSRLKGSSRGIGARRERVSAEKLLGCEIEVPPIVEQRSVLREIATLNAVRAAHVSRLPRLSALLPAALNTAFNR
jgi:restriction endonuclease S subunit